MRKDIEHLNLLAIFHYVMAGLTALTALFPLLYVVLGVVIISAGVPAPAPGPGGTPAPAAGGPPPAFVGWMMAIFGGVASLVLFAAAVAIGTAGYCLHKRKWRIFCFVMAAILCTQAPLGTALGVFTIIVLCRPGMERLFSGKPLYDDPDDDETYDPLPASARDERPLPRPDEQGFYSPRGELP